MSVEFNPIGIIHTPFNLKDGMPIQANGAMGVKGHIELNKELTLGLQDLEGFSHIILLYYFHQSKGYDLLVTPFLDTEKHGIFSTRAPKRPNQIGFSVVRLLGIKKNILFIENVDILDKTPLLDIKPYIPEFDCFEVDKTGWLKPLSQKIAQARSDGRF